VTEPCHDDVCITCADALFPLVVERLSEDGTMAWGLQNGERSEVSVELVDGVEIGDTVLVHGGVALQIGEKAVTAGGRTADKQALPAGGPGGVPPL
jgi:hydrogenase maturation factor